MPNDSSSFGLNRPAPVVARIIALTRRCPDSWSGRRRAFALRSLAMNFLGDRPADVEAMGVNMRLYPRHNMCEKRILFTPQFFDPAERKLLASRIGEDFTFIDVGANVGGYALHVAALAGPRARVLAIEPQHAIYERLVFNIRQNAFSTVKALECAVADRECEITLFVDEDNRGQSSIRVIPPDGGGHQVRVPAKALAAIVAEEDFAKVDALKLDVEGAEDLILEAFLRDAPRFLWPRLLIVDYAHGRWAGGLFPLLEAAGYTEVLRTRANVGFELTGTGTS